MSTIYILHEIMKNCKDERKKKATLDFLNKKIDTLPQDDKLRPYLLELISIFNTVEPKICSTTCK